MSLSGSTAYEEILHPMVVQGPEQTPEIELRSLVRSVRH